VVRARASASRFAPGDRVRVSSRPVVGHCRTPWYLRGKTGVVAEVHGTFRNPEQLAYHKPGLPGQVLYKVRFAQAEIWARYEGHAGDHLEADIYEHWLEPLK
jgi:Nitrile hydratase beta subunit, C-terminal